MLTKVDIRRIHGIRLQRDLVLLRVSIEYCPIRCRVELRISLLLSFLVTFHCPIETESDETRIEAGFCCEHRRQASTDR